MPKLLDSFPDETPSPFIAAEVEAKVSQCLEIYPDIERPTVTYDLKGHTAGYAYIKENRIRLNLDLLNDPRYREDMISDTVPHELAHLITHALYPYAKSHGHEWKYIAYRLGAKPETCHQYETVAARKRKPMDRPFLYPLRL